MAKVSKEVAYRYANSKWSVDRIKAVHDRHVHEIDGSRLVISQACPKCEHCRCPVPDEEHQMIGEFDA